MKINFKLFSKTFLLAFLAFAVISGIIITSLYLDADAVDPLNKESNVLIGLTNDDSLLSLCILNFDPQNNSIKFLPIPDNVWIENGIVLQSLYKKHSISNLKISIETLIGAKINRYMILSMDDIVDLNNDMGQFSMTSPYPFEHNGEPKSGTLNINGEILRSMFTYSGYDMTQVSISNIGYSYLKTFIDIYTKPTHIGRLTETISDKSFINTIHTNIKRKEMEAYCNLLTNYSLMAPKKIEISGKYDTQPYSSTYFIPDNPKPEQNIFK